MNRKTRRPSTGAEGKAPPAPADDQADGFIGPSPNPRTNLLFADLALRGGGTLLRHGLERGLLGKQYAPDKAKNILNARSMSDSLLSLVAVKVATRSVPGAILVGGGLLAKTLYDLRKGKAASAKGAAQLETMAVDGKHSQDS